MKKTKLPLMLLAALTGATAGGAWVFTKNRSLDRHSPEPSVATAESAAPPAQGFPSQARGLDAGKPGSRKAPAETLKPPRTAAIPASRAGGVPAATPSPGEVAAFDQEARRIESLPGGDRLLEGAAFLKTNDRTFPRQSAEFAVDLLKRALGAADDSAGGSGGDRVIELTENSYRAVVDAFQSLLLTDPAAAADVAAVDISQRDVADQIVKDAIHGIAASEGPEAVIAAIRAIDDNDLHQAAIWEFGEFLFQTSTAIEEATGYLSRVAGSQRTAENIFAVLTVRARTSGQL